MDHIVQSQEEVFAFLADPANHGGETIKRVDTHAAVLFLAGERVLKVKRAVRFAFLDFSTLQKRQRACESEIEVNRALAPDIYRGVLAITREHNGRLAIAGTGPAIEYAVEMRRFDESLTLDHLAAAGRIDDVLANALGRAVAAAHAQAPVIEPAPWIAAVRAYIDEHVVAFGETPDLFPLAEVEALARAGRDAYERIHPLLVERGQCGLIRHTHGDLHLGNIVLLDGRPVLFDAIEFSPLIASGDVLYDLAFLLMDLLERGLGAAANSVFNRYLVETGRAEDLDALAALPYFLSMRAAIRAKVTAARLQQAAGDALPPIRASARKYFDLARRFLAPSPPLMLAVGGLSGTGKSVLARALAPRIGASPGAVVLRSDTVRKALFGKGESEPLSPEAYRHEVTMQVFATLADCARRAVAAGHSVIVDAVYAGEDQRALLETSAAALGVLFRGLFLHADLDTRMARVGSRRGDASDATAEVARLQESYDLGPLGNWTRIDASDTAGETLRRAEAALGLQST